MKNPTGKVVKSLRISRTNTYTLAKNRTHYPHSHEFLELYIHISGKAEYMIENGIWPIDYGSVVITRENELHCIRISEDCILQNIYCEFERGLFENFAPELLSCFDDRPLGQRCVISLPRETTDRCVAKLLDACAAAEEASSIGMYEARAGFMSVLCEVNRVWARQDIFGTAESVPFSARSMLYGKAISMFYEHCADIRTVGEFADRLYVSREHLSRCFSAEIGIPVSKFMVQSRVRLSTFYLKQGFGLDEVCSKCGWNDYSYFISTFRREIGITPAKYREKYFGKRGGG